LLKGKKLATKKEENLYLKLNKPPGYTCTRKSFIKEKKIFSLFFLFKKNYSLWDD